MGHNADPHAGMSAGGQTGRIKVWLQNTVVLLCFTVFRNQYYGMP
jgi:hypothetical protein